MSDHDRPDKPACAHERIEVRTIRDKSLAETKFPKVRICRDCHKEVH